MDNGVKGSMDNGVKVKWVKALRSGNYQQTHFELTDGKAYCCLGVLCKVLDKPLQYSGLPLTEQQKTTFIKLNDKDNLNFQQIADYIEKTYG